MFRVLMFLTMSVLSVGAAAKVPPTNADSGLASMIIKGPVYHYSLKKDQDPSVCKHMLKVFNDKFTHLWARPLVTSVAEYSKIYSASSKYAFPLLPGVKHSVKATSEMAFSAQPTSPEFSAIRWKEGTAIPGGCPAGETCPGEAPEPILVAYYDFDNDGSIDTVIQGGHFPGYELMLSGTQEHLTVWRGQRLEIMPATNLWNLAHPKDKILPIGVSGLYLRPFIYQGISYVASYIPHFAPVSGPAALSFYMPPYPNREDILIEKYHYAGRKQATTGRPEWISDTVCDLKMQRLSN